MKNILVLVFGLCITFINAQTYHPILKTDYSWDVLHGDASICYHSSGNRYFVSNDTLLYGKVYKIIKSCPIINLIPGPFCPPYGVSLQSIQITAFMREDSITKKVYELDQNNNTDKLVYDFSLSIGDTLKTWYTQNNNVIIITSIHDVSLLNGESRKLFELSNGKYFIEGVGGSQGLLGLLIDLEYNEDPICMKINNFGLWNFGGNQCLEIVGLNEIKDFTKINVFPNPSSETVRLKIENLKLPATFELIDNTGKIVMTKNILNKDNLLYLKEFRSGIYYYRIFDTKNIYSNMLVITK